MPDDPQTNPMPPTAKLSEADAAALDVVLGQNGSGGTGSDQNGPEPADAARVQRVEALLRLLETDRGTPVGNADASGKGTGGRGDFSTTVPGDLVARTLARIANTTAAEVNSVATAPPAAAVQPSTLSDADAAALDAVVASRALGSDTVLRLADDETDQAAAAQRTQRVTGLLELLDRDQPTTATAPPTDLADRTVDAVQQARQRERFAEQIDMLRHGPRSAGVSLRQVAAAAAVFLLGVSLLLPMLENNRAMNQRVACAGNLGLVGKAFNAYATDHAGVLPRGRSLPGTPWWNVGLPNAVLPDGTVLSNSAHLYTIVRAGYATPDQLACRTNAYAPGNGQMTVQHLDWSRPMDVSYSYQNQFTPEALNVDNARPTLAVLADKNPLFVPRHGRIVFDPDVPVDAPSRLHRGEGQNVLTIDGSAGWTTTPNAADRVPADDMTPADEANGDNFWSVSGKADGYRYTGTELPTNVETDAFLVP